MAHKRSKATRQIIAIANDLKANVQTGINGQVKFLIARSNMRDFAMQEKTALDFEVSTFILKDMANSAEPILDLLTPHRKRSKILVSITCLEVRR